MSLLRQIGASVFAAIAFLALTTGQTSAATYQDSFTYNLNDVRCGYFVDVQLCTAYQALASPRSANAGDQFNIQATFDRPLVVPGSITGSTFHVTALDNTATFGPGAPGPLVSSSTLVMVGYNGPSNPLEGPFNLNGNFGYGAVGGFCCGYGVPTPGFSLTGANATINVLTSDPNPIVGVAVGYSRQLAATPSNLTQLQGGDLTAPLLLPPGLIGQITGNIGGTYPPESFYNFNWGGGFFQTRATLNGANPLDVFKFQLFDTGDLSDPVAEYFLSLSNGFTDLMTVSSMGPGNYTIGIKAAGPNDPQFTLDFYTPIGSAVPEPSAWAMMIVGFGVAGSMVRRARILNSISAS